MASQIGLQKLFQLQYDKFPFFKEFDSIVVSGQEKIIKPGKEIFQLLLDRYNLKAGNTIFIDDNINNIKAAEELGLYAIHFKDAGQLERKLSSINMI